MTELTLKEIAKSIDARIIGNGDMLISGISSITSPKPGTILYADKVSMLPKLKGLDKIAVIVPSEPSEINGDFLVHPKPRVAFAMVSQMFYPSYWIYYDGISECANIESGANISDTATISPGAYIGEGAVIGERVKILPNAFVGRGVVIGDDSVILPGAVILENSRIGERTIINSNAVIGSEGFGFMESGHDIVKMPQVGGVQIGDDVEIGSGTCVDRGTIDDTVIGSGTKIDNLVQIGHNVKIGKNVRIAAQAGFPGRVVVEDDAIIGGQAGIQNGITIGKGSRIAGQAGVFKSVEAGKTVSGYPAMNHADALVLIALFKRLPEMLERIVELEKKFEV